MPGGRADRFLQNAEYFGGFWVGDGRKKYSCGGVGLRVLALGGAIRGGMILTFFSRRSAPPVRAAPALDTS